MKKCSKCGAINDNLYKNCIDCRELLGPPVSKAELEEEEFEHSKSKRKAAYRSEYYHVSKSDKTVSMLLTIGAVLHLIYFLKHDAVNANYSLVLLIVMLWMVVEAISMLKPALSWNIYRLRYARTPEYHDFNPTHEQILLHKGIAYLALLIGYSLIFDIILRILL